MFILYFGALSSFWLKCTRSGEMAPPGAWQRAHSLSGSNVAAAFGSRFLLKNVCRTNQEGGSVEDLLSWQVRQAWRLALDFQLSPWGVAGFAPVWHLVQLRRSCGK